MTEVVTNSAASLQQTLVAERQQRAFGVSASNSDTNSQPNPAFTRPNGALASDAVARAPKSDQPQADSRRQDQPSPDQKIKRVVPDPAEAGASRSESRGEAVKVELKDFDVGRRAAEVVGTPDVVQRFDNNSDGRVDLLESQRAAKARDSAITFSARGTALSESPSVAEQVQTREIAEAAATPAPQAAAPSQPAPANQAGQSAEPGVQPKRIFEDAQVVVGGPSEDGAVPKKLFGSEEVASQGTFSDGAPVDQKFFGDGVEVVRGRFANDPEVQQKIFDDSAQAEPGRFYEDGSGEQKLYDKVAQTETGRFYDDGEQKKLYDESELPQAGGSGGEEQADQSLYEKAQEVEAQTATADPADQQPKKIYGELDLYADVAGLGEETVEVPVVGVGPVTA